MQTLKNVITINDFNYSQGGASKVAIDTANMVSENGLNSIFVSAVSDDERCTLNRNVVQYKFNGREFLHYDNRIKGMIDGIKCKSFSHFVEYILDQYNVNETVVHIHGWTKACSSDFFNVLKKRRFRTFLTLHEYFSFCPNGAYYNYKTNKACDKKGCSFKCLLCNCDSRNYLFKVYRYIRTVKYKRDVDFQYVNAIFVSEFEKKIICNQLRIYQSIVIENPISPLNVDATCLKDYDFVYVGRTSQEKGVDLFVKLACAMKNKRFLLIGDYNSNLKNLYVTGWVSEKEVDFFLVKSKVLIFPSRWPETFGLNVIRALSANIPCIVSSNTAAQDYVIDGQNGYIFSQGKLEELVDIVKNKKMDILSSGCVSNCSNYFNNVKNAYISLKGDQV